MADPVELKPGVKVMLPIAGTNWLCALSPTNCSAYLKSPSLSTAAWYHHWLVFAAVRTLPSGSTWRVSAYFVKTGKALVLTICDDTVFTTVEVTVFVTVTVPETGRVCVVLIGTGLPMSLDTSIWEFITDTGKVCVVLIAIVFVIKPDIGKIPLVLAILKDETGFKTVALNVVTGLSILTLPEIGITDDELIATVLEIAIGFLIVALKAETVAR